MADIKSSKNDGKDTEVTEDAETQVPESHSMPVPEENNEKLPDAGEQKQASDANVVVDGRSSLVGGPSQDELNPAFAPTRIVEDKLVDEQDKDESSDENE